MVGKGTVHVPVMLEEVREAFASVEDGIVVDLTVGAGGHAKALLERAPGRVVFGLDRDPRILEHARRALAEFSARVILRRGCFDAFEEIFPELDQRRPRGFLFDLGVSSLQLDDPNRGFSFDRDGPLDMRMSEEEQAVSAEDIVNRWPIEKLETVFRDFGEEPRARAMARAIVDARKRVPIKTTGALAAILERVGPRFGKKHPATRVFQALRLAVNGELERLSTGLDRAIGKLEANGRIAVISFHSLEDRIVKQTFRDRAKAGELKLLTKKPLTPGAAEVTRNRRARSAKLRLAERTDAGRA